MVQLSSTDRESTRTSAAAAGAPAVAGLRILIATADERGFKLVCARLIVTSIHIGSVHWQDDYDGARTALTRGGFDLALLDTHHHGIALLQATTGDFPRTPVVLLGDHPSDLGNASADSSVFLDRTRATSEGLQRAIDEVMSRRAAARAAMHSQIWWRSGGQAGSHAVEFPLSAAQRGTFLPDGVPPGDGTPLLEDALRRLPVIAGRLDSTGCIAMIEGAGLKRHGLTRRALRGRSFLDIFPAGREALDRANSGHAARFETCVNAGTERAWHVAFDLFPAGEAGDMIGFFGRETAVQRCLEGEVLSAVDAERHRIGADLHDEVGQLLTGMSCLGAALAERLRGAHDLAAEDAAMIASTAKEALAQVRALSHGLAPVHLARQGLPLALEEFREQMRRMHNVELQLNLQAGQVAFDVETTAHVFRIVQEASANAIRHGHATTVLVSLCRTGRQHRLEITDNGRGFDAACAPATGGAGLSLMQYRARLINGHLTVTSSPTAGTRLTISFTSTHTHSHETAC